MSIHRHLCTFVACIALSASTGCGAAKQAMGLAPPIHDDTFEAVLGHPEFEQRSSDAECVALGLKVDASRNLFEVSSEMEAVKATAAWKVLDNAYDAFSDAGCPAITADHENVSDNCAHLGDDVASAWSDLQDTPAWQAALTNSDLKDLVAKWQSAKSIACYKH